MTAFFAFFSLSNKCSLGEHYKKKIFQTFDWQINFKKSLVTTKQIVKLNGRIMRTAIRSIIVVYESKRAQRIMLLLENKQSTILKFGSESLCCEKYCWTKTRNAGHGWTSLSAPLFSCNDCCYITYKS